MSNPFAVLATAPAESSGEASEVSRIEEVAEEVDADWLKFVKPDEAGEVRVTPPFEDVASMPGHCCLLAVSNAWDLVFVGSEANILIFKLSVISRTAAQSKAQPARTLELPHSATWIRLAINDRRLVLGLSGGAGVVVYDVKAVMADDKIPPLHTFTEVSDPLLDLLPNPSLAGALPHLTLAVGPAETRILGIGGPDGFKAVRIVKEETRCAAWSAKGKQFVVGLKNGSLAQYAPDGTRKASIPPPSAVDDGNHYPTAVFWLENDVFLVTYNQLTSDDDREPVQEHKQYLITRDAKTQPPTFSYTLFEDILPNFGMMDRSADMRQLAHMRNVAPNAKHLAIMSSGSASDLAVLAADTDASNKPSWKILLLEETVRPTVPLTADYGETCCLGIDFDLRSEMPVKQAMEGGVARPDLPPQPRLIEYTSDGVLVIYNMISQGSETFAGMMKSQDIAQAGEEEVVASPAPYAAASLAPATPSPLAVNPFAAKSSEKPALGFGSVKLPTMGGGFGKTSTPAFGTSAFGSPSPAGPAKPVFGASAFGQSAFGSPAASGSAIKTAEPAAAKSESPGSSAGANAPASALGASGTFGAAKSSSFGTSAFGKPAAFGSTASPSTPSPAFGASAFGKPSAFASSATGGSASPSGAFGASAFGKPANGGSTSSSPSSASPAFGASAFGASAFGKPSAFGAPAATGTTPSSGSFGTSAFSSFAKPASDATKPSEAPTPTAGPADSTDSAFGKPPGPVSDKAAPPSALGAKASPNPFATTSTASQAPTAASPFGSSAFGKPASPAFGASAFGKSSAFGANTAASKPSSDSAPVTGTSGTSTGFSFAAGAAPSAFGLATKPTQNAEQAKTDNSAQKDNEPSASADSFGLTGLGEMLGDSSKSSTAEASLTSSKPEPIERPSPRDVDSEAGATSPPLGDPGATAGSDDDYYSDPSIHEGESVASEDGQSDGDNRVEDGELLEDVENASETSSQAARELDPGSEASVSPPDSEPEAKLPASEASAESAQSSRTAWADSNTAKPLPAQTTEGVSAVLQQAEAKPAATGAPATTDAGKSSNPFSNFKPTPSPTPLPPKASEPPKPTTPASGWNKQFSGFGGFRGPSTLPAKSSPLAERSTVFGGSDAPKATTSSKPTTTPQTPMPQVKEQSQPATPAPAPVSAKPETATSASAPRPDLAARDATTPSRRNGAIDPAPSIATPARSNLADQYYTIYQSMQTDLRSLDHTWRKVEVYHEEAKPRFADPPLPEDVEFASFWSFALLDLFGKYIGRISDDASEAQASSATMNDEVKKIFALVPKANSKSEDCARYVRASRDRDFAKRLRARHLGPEQADNQVALRMRTKTTLDRLEKLEHQLLANKRRISQQRTGRTPIRAPALDSMNRTIANVSEQLQHDQEELQGLSKRLRAISLVAKQSPKEAADSAPYFLGGSAHVQEMVDAAGKLQEGAQRLRSSAMQGQAKAKISRPAAKKPLVVVDPAEPVKAPVAKVDQAPQRLGFFGLTGSTEGLKSISHKTPTPKRSSGFGRF